MAKKLSKKDLKNLKTVLQDKKKEEQIIEVIEKKGLRNEIEEENLENLINESNNQINTANFRRLKLNDVNPSLEQEDINLEQSIINTSGRRVNDDIESRNANPLSNAYLSAKENQDNLYTSNTNLYGTGDTNNQNAYQEINPTSNITSLEQQRLNQTSINNPQRLNFHQDQEFQKTEDLWKFDSQDKNITSIEESRRKEKERRFYQ